MTIHEKTLEQIFVSKVRVKALKFFMLNPTKSIHLRGAVREFEEEINAVRRELLRLESAKLLIAEDKGNRKYFRLNLEHPFINELMGLFHQAHGLGGEIVENIKALGDIHFAFLTSAYTKGFYYGMQVVDLVIIGQVEMDVLDHLIKKYEQESGRDIHYTVLKPSEYTVRKRRSDQFLIDLMMQDIVMLHGSREELIR